ncbi:MAG: DUF362 domain-containing protein [bacterium]|nr:DUF362 domain-containing protein [bacterium]
MSEKMNRREFIQKSSGALLGAGLAFSPGFLQAAGETGKSKIVEASHSLAVSKDRKVNAGAVKKMLRDGMNELTGSKSPWQYFLNKNDKVGLKINTLGRLRLFTHRELIQAVVDELLEFGIKENNIIVWDRFERHMNDCKLDLNNTAKGVRYFGTAELALKYREQDSKRFDPHLNYTTNLDNPAKRIDGSNVSRISSIFTNECDKIINLPILKDHGLAGVTLCMKNIAFGVTDNTDRVHGRKHIDSFITGVYSLPVVSKKVVLHILDGLEGCWDTGPMPRSNGVIFAPKKLWLGTDPVAIDSIGLQAIEEKRKIEELPNLASARRYPECIRMAAEIGIGTDNPSLIDLKKVVAG